MEEKLNKIINFTQDLIFEVDESGLYINIWTSNEELLVRPKKELIGKNLKEFIPADKAKVFLAKIQTVLKSNDGLKIEYDVITPSGIKYFTGRMVPLRHKNKKTVIFHARNITAEKSKELNLKNIGKLAKIGTWELDILNNKKFCSLQVCEIYNIEPNSDGYEIDSLLSVYDKENRQLIDEAIKRCMLDKTPCDLELSLQVDNRKKFLRATGYPITGPDGSVIKMAGTLQDVTEHKNLSRAFEDQKSKLTRIIQQAPGIFFRFRMTEEGEFSFPYISANITKVLGFDPQKIINGEEPLIGKILTDDLGSWMLALEKSISALVDFEWRGRVLDSKGEIKWIFCQSTPKKIHNQTIIWDGIMFDITKRKNEEDELEEKQKSVNHQLKLASLGELAAGVAHEITNPLAIVNNVLERIIKQIGEEVVDKKSLETLIDYALDASKRIETITKGLQIFSRADIKALNSFNITESICTTVKLISELYRSQNIEVVFECDPKEHIVYGNRGRLDQVLMNLVSNAKDAVKEKVNGRIKIQLICDKDNCYINVSDNGSGIPKDISDKIFDPFFSTKGVGKGSGIGLSIANSIIREHKGTLKFETANTGSTFRVCFPRNSDLEEEV